jgi:hypothetical protein
MLMARRRHLRTTPVACIFQRGKGSEANEVYGHYGEEAPADCRTDLLESIHPVTWTVDGLREAPSSGTGEPPGR